jgi:hypothetical protein
MRVIHSILTALQNAESILRYLNSNDNNKKKHTRRKNGRKKGHIKAYTVRFRPITTT